MPKNLELKAAIDSSKFASAVCRKLGARRGGILMQTDTYFHARRGRLKLREINRRECELIYYHRRNLKGIRTSDYVVVPLKEPRTIKDVCRKVFGIKAIVRKKRLLFLYKNARIHIDSVKGLGTFIEFEVIVNRTRNQARRLMHSLIAQFGIAPRSIVAGSYVDLIIRKKVR